uniref:O-acyl-ADP-ribose deacylase 1 n=1 Tax=Neogobius melanostomus TaxID=47308 RepID=A0A8C6UUS7_9GOBI
MSSEVKTSTETAQCSDRTWSITYVTGNLFTCPSDESLAHCISEDYRMGAGIAVRFKKEFEGVEDLKAQKKEMGQCAVLKSGKRFVYYLITKKRYNHKPTYNNLRQSLEDMKRHCETNGVSKVSMPRIGCGLDRLAWRRVSEILKEVFENSNISVTVYSLPEKTETTVMKENARRK